MLNFFLIWAGEKIHELKMNGYEGVLTRSLDSDNPSARLDIESERAIARITFWDSGEADWEIIDMESGKTVYSEQRNLIEPPDFAKEFDRFLTVLLQGNSFLQHSA